MRNAIHTSNLRLLPPFRQALNSSIKFLALSLHESMDCLPHLQCPEDTDDV